MTQVTLLDTMELATFCVRTFSLHKVKEMQLYPPPSTAYPLFNISSIENLQFDSIHEFPLLLPELFVPALKPTIEQFRRHVPRR